MTAPASASHDYIEQQRGVHQQPGGGTPYMAAAAVPGPVMGQPSGVQFMLAPSQIPGIPPGLEYLTQIDQLLVHQQVEMFEMITGWETCNKYQIKNSLGQQVFFAAEESDTCMRQCCGPAREFTMHITDNLGREVIRVHREFKCCAGWNCCANFDCCAMELQVEAPVGSVIGYVKQQKSCLAAKYAILDANHEKILRIEGPVCICQGLCCTADINFKILSLEADYQVGKISRQWPGLFKEMFTKADNFGVNFPMDLDVRCKATILGALFLIEFMHFEQKKNNDNGF